MYFRYLDWDPSSYPVLKTMKQNIDMYSTLWHTALDFHENYEKWYSGPVSQLKSDAIKTKARKYVNAFNQINKYFCLMMDKKYPCTGTKNSLKVEEMFKNATDLSSLFADSPAPRSHFQPFHHQHHHQVSSTSPSSFIMLCFRRIADAVRTKIEKFKVHLFVLGQHLS